MRRPAPATASGPGPETAATPAPRPRGRAVARVVGGPGRARSRRLTRRRSRRESRSGRPAGHGVPTRPGGRECRNRSPSRPTLPSPPVPSLGGEDAPPPTATPGRQPAAGPDLSPVPSTAPSLPSITTDGYSDRLGLVVVADGRLHPRTGLASTCIDASGSVQSMVMTSSQAGYVSAAATSPAAPSARSTSSARSRSTSSRVVVSDFRPSCCRVHRASSPPASGTCKVKKPCFLKTWLHHKSGCKIKGCKGCKTCSYCGEPATMVSSQGPIVSGQW